ncbi:MAG: hypothetical protein AAF004_13170 [Pseudomonadota bacterium]
MMNIRYLLLLIALLATTACGTSDQEANSLEVASDTTSAAAKDVQQVAKATAELPDFTQYPGVCPKDWGIVSGAAQSHVENFVQNYFYVPESTPGPMTSSIDRFSVAGGGTLLKAATYNMADNIVDQEMVMTFVAAKMTQCASRLRCAKEPESWVASCD